MASESRHGVPDRPRGCIKIRRKAHRRADDLKQTGKPDDSRINVDQEHEVGVVMAAVALAQGLYFVVSGAWALVHIESFQRVTGPKTDLWLVKTVGLLLVAIGAGLLLAVGRQLFDPALILIAMGSAAALLSIELVHVGKRVIARIYLLDALVEAGFLIAWATCLLGQ